MCRGRPLDTPTVNSYSIVIRMYFKSNYSLIEHSGMLHMNLYCRTDEKNSFFFLKTLISAQTSQSLLLVFTIHLFFSLNLFGAKEITYFHSVFLLDIRTFQCVFLVMACALYLVFLASSFFLDLAEPPKKAHRTEGPPQL